MPLTNKKKKAKIQLVKLTNYIVFIVEKESNVNTPRTSAADEIALFCRLQMYARKELPIRSSEMGVLIYVHQQNHGITPLMISHFFQITKPSVTAMVNELVKKGYLMKEPSSTDKRSYYVQITEKGTTLVGSAQESYFKSIDLLMKKMGDSDFLKFIELIQRANEILSEEKCV